MKIIQLNFLLFCLLGVMSTKAQPIITSDQISPIVGDVFNLQYASTTSYNDPGVGGANVSWDYSKMIDSLSIFNIFVLSPTGLFGVENFPTANIALLNSTQTFYDFYHVDSNSFGQVGQFDTFFNSLNSYVPQLTRTKFPLKYNSVYTDSFSYSDPSLPAGYTVKGYDTIKIDAYGTLKLPKYTFKNVLRQNQTITLVLYFNGQSVTKAKQTFYDFGVVGIHHPILQLSSTTNQTGTWEATYYSDSPLSMKITTFIASWQDKRPYLNWITENNNNTKTFIIQRSLDGNNFINVGQVNANSANDYSFADNFAPNESVFYRILQLDNTGHTYYSNTLILTENTKQLSIFPNPSKGAVHLSIPVGSKVAISTYNVSGKLMYENKSFSASDVLYTDLWESGTYYVRVKDSKGWHVRRFQKQ